MIFTEPRFLLFFAVVFAIHWALRGNRTRKLWLLVCSYAFYAAWDWRFLSLIGFSTLVDYTIGLRLMRLPPEHERARRAWLILSLASNLGLLAVFKYFGFFVDSAVRFLGWLGIGASPWSLEIILPVGISFYTFQTLSYTIDIYRGRLRATRDLPDFALFVAFFPQLVAGPIVRALDFMPQIVSVRRANSIDWRGAAMLFSLGFFKKACVSDNLAPIVDAYFANPAGYDAFASWTAILSYATQIYCDFSGYSDMAIASAALLGYRLGKNFDAPYLASNIRDFWRRWHISLSSWLRDYLYIPLGGSRHGPVARDRNLFLTMALGGLWHGAAWGFVFWGMAHGFALIAHRQWCEHAPAGLRAAIPMPIAALLTFSWVSLLWVPFRAESLSSAWVILQAALLGRGAGSDSFEPLILSTLVVLALGHAALHVEKFEAAWRRAPGWVFAAGLGALLAMVTTFRARNVEPFIYFQF